MPNNPGNELADALNDDSKKTSGKSGRRIAAIIFIALLIAMPFGAQFVADKYVNGKITVFLKSISGVCSVQYGSAVYNIWNRDLTIKNIAVKCDGEDTLTIDETVMNAIVGGTPVPSNMITEISGGTFFPQAKVFGQLAALSKKLEYSSIPFHGRIAYTHGVASKDFTVSTFNIIAEGVGEVSAELKVPAVKAQTMNGFINGVWENAPANFWISFKNTELATQIIAFYAKETGIEPAKAKAAVLRGLENRISRKFKSDIPTRERLVQLYRFFQNQGELIVKLDAKQNTSLKNVYESMNYKGWRAFTDSLANFKPEFFTN